MRHTSLHLVVLVGLLLFVAACGSPAPAPAAAPTAVPPTAVAPTEPPPPSPTPAPTATVAAKATSAIAVSPTITEMVKLGDITMYYASHGKGEPLLLLHGGMGSADNFGGQVRSFELKSRVITPDSRGQGRTTDSDAPLSYHLMAEDMIRLMDYLKIEKAYVVGWSDGGIIGLDMAVHHPERVRALVAYGANISPEGSTPEFLDYMKKTSTEALAKEAGAEYLRLSSTPEHLPVFIEKLRKLYVTAPFLTPEELASIKCPTAIVDGKREEYIKLDHVEVIAKAIPNAKLIWIPDGTHYAPLMLPLEFNTIVLDFLKDK